MLDRLAAASNARQGEPQPLLMFDSRLRVEDGL
jgi:hypothetical protein